MSNVLLKKKFTYQIERTKSANIDADKSNFFKYNFVWKPTFVFIFMADVSPRDNNRDKSKNMYKDNTSC